MNKKSLPLGLHMAVSLQVPSAWHVIIEEPCIVYPASQETVIVSLKEKLVLLTEPFMGEGSSQAGKI